MSKSYIFIVKSFFANIYTFGDFLLITLHFTQHKFGLAIWINRFELRATWILFGNYHIRWELY